MEFNRGLSLAEMYSKCSECKTRKVGCVILNDKTGEVVSYGYNKPLSTSWCTTCNRESGKNLDKCMAIHAEAMALSDLPSDVNKDDLTMYLTTEPCTRCGVEIAYKGIKRVYWRDDYPYSLAGYILHCHDIDGGKINE